MVVLLSAIVVGLSTELLRGDPNSTGSQETPAQGGNVFAMAGTIGKDNYGVYLVDSRKGNLFAVGGQIAEDKYGLYLVDVERGVMALYEWMPRTRKLRWLSSRNFSNDLKIDDYNTELKPARVRELVEQSRPMGSSR
ncbi:MAG: hypothetical protein ACLFV7_07545 [Phycisphaerae bacterium]